MLLREEAAFSSLYGETGRPNWSVARMLGVLILQELANTHDQAALDLLAYDIRWQFALDVAPNDAYLSRRSLVQFRTRLVSADPEMTLMRGVFEAIGSEAIEKLGVSTSEQRIDSTHVTSNIRTRGRTDLFARTLMLFLRAMLKEEASKLARLPKPLRAWFAKRTDEDGWEDVPSAQSVQQLAEWLVLVTRTFAADPIAETEPYQLVARLVAEHCIVTECDEPEDGGDDEGPNGGSDMGSSGNEGPDGFEPDADDSDADGSPDGNEDAKASSKVHVRTMGKGAGTSLQSPHDPDAGYSSHKGVGYSVQIAETCGNHPNGEGPPEMITDFNVHSAGKRDFGETLPALGRLAAAERLPRVLYGDSHYVSGSMLVEAESQGVRLHSPAGRGRLPADMVGREQFNFDDETGEMVSCPEGHRPVSHVVRTTSVERPKKLHAKMDRAHCEACPLAGRCVARPPNGGKGNWHVDIELELRKRDENLAAQKTDEWRIAYRIRSGIEATNSELKRTHGLRRLRVRTQPRVTLAVAAKLTACNVKRWLRAG